MGNEAAARRLPVGPSGLTPLLGAHSPHMLRETMLKEESFLFCLVFTFADGALENDL